MERKEAMHVTQYFTAKGGVKTVAELLNTLAWYDHGFTARSLVQR